jgi:membrane protease YdiL (CAAX protease family)
LVFALVTITLFAGSAVFSLIGLPALGVLYNQLVIIGAAAILALAGNWSWRDIFRFNIPRGIYVLLAVAAGVSAWWVNAGIMVGLQRLLGRVVGPMPDIEPDFGAWGILAIIFATLILAPFCEEVLFRGYIQRAYEYTHPRRAWIYSGLLFGLLHVGNSLTSVLTASLLGLLLGYAVWKSNSIFPAIVAHFAINITALLFALPVHSALIAQRFPLWLLVASLAGLGLFIFFFRWLSREGAKDQVQTAPFAEEEQEIVVLILPHPRPNSLVLRIVPMVVALLILGLTGAGEIALRAGWIDFDQYDGRFNISIESLEGEKTLAEVEVSAPGTLNISYTIAGQAIQAAVEIVAPDGVVHWRRRWHEGALPSFSDAFSTAATEAGTWIIRVRGKAESLELTLAWKITE